MVGCARAVVNNDINLVENRRGFVVIAVAKYTKIKVVNLRRSPRARGEWVRSKILRQIGVSPIRFVANRRSCGAITLTKVKVGVLTVDVNGNFIDCITTIEIGICPVKLDSRIVTIPCSSNKVARIKGDLINYRIKV